MKQLVVISPEATVENETSMVNALFDEGLQLFHLRKPDFSCAEQECYLSEIKPEYLECISLHQHRIYDLSGTIKRFHFKESERRYIDKKELEKGKKTGKYFSSSVHEVKMMEYLLSGWDYIFLGPVFSSISKPEYENKDLEDIVLHKKKNTPNIIAIGGVNPANAESILNRGFDGIALLGCIWKEPDKAMSTFKKLMRVCKN